MIPLKDDEIRLLVLNDSFNKDYSLIHVSLDHPPKFYALSYAWTDDSLFPASESPCLHQIRLDGHNTTLGPNLAAALKAWRSNEYSEVPLWVDFLCIDQKNILERNHQVLRMYAIYERSSLVTVWLGPDKHDSELAFGFMDTFVRQARDLEWVRRSIRERTFSREWRAVNHLLHRNWWKRVWIIQEMVAASEIVFVCGRQLIQRNVILQFFEALIYTDATCRRLLAREEAIELSGDSITLANTYLRPHAWTRRNLLQTLYTTGKSSATDQRDKIYGVLGLAEDAKSLIGIPNYLLSTEDVYKRFCASFLKEHQSLEFLSLAGLPVFPRTSGLSLPTWAPDWHHRKISSLNSKIRPATSTNAAGGLKAHATFSDDLGILTALGICVDVIDGLGSPDWATSREYKLQQTKSQESAYNPGPATLEAFSRTLIGDSSIRHKPHTGLDTLAVFIRCCQDVIDREQEDQAVREERKTMFNVWYDCHRDFSMGGRSLREWVTSVNFDFQFSGDMETAKERYIHKLSVTHGPSRRLMTTSKGFIGLAVNSCMPGDLVCVIYGCSTPVLLRRIGDHCIFLGEAYLHGIMNGEAIDGLQRGELNEEAFLIY
ncbi:heterokaryon incompatibility protein-domain-containing protein [Cadophora sp. MPI-SDFR-AT-0126]|nr:heterokaryon incompatibility protein-domain-containing protein [Leotiomycetes sp. MPI-SDFR-AT-0126]